MELVLIWRQFFSKWPQGLAQRGVLVTTFGEQIAFANFMLAEHMIMLERNAPDSVGGRKVLLPYSGIAAVKVTDPVNNEIFTTSGFTSVAPRQPVAT